MKALTVKQPWANKIASGKKTIETRVWYAKYRGPLLIHSSKSPAIDPAGFVLCVVTLLDCHKMTKEDEQDACCPVYPRAYALVLGKLWRLPKPFRMSGERFIYDAEGTYNAPQTMIRLVRSAYLAGCWKCDRADLLNLGQGPICDRRDRCEHWHRATMTPIKAITKNIL